MDDFALRVPGGEERPPHRSLLPETEMPAGTTLSGVLVFDVPRDATVGLLSYGDGGRCHGAAPARGGGFRAGTVRDRVGHRQPGHHPTDHATP